MKLSTCLVKCLFRVFAHFSIRLSEFLLFICFIVCIWALSQICVVQIPSPTLGLFLQISAWLSLSSHLHSDVALSVKFILTIPYSEFLPETTWYSSSLFPCFDFLLVCMTTWHATYFFLSFFLTSLPLHSTPSGRNLFYFILFIMFQTFNIFFWLEEFI